MGRSIKRLQLSWEESMVALIGSVVMKTESRGCIHSQKLLLLKVTECGS